MILSFSKKFPTVITNTSGSTQCGIAPSGTITLGLNKINETVAFYESYAETAYNNLLSGVFTAVDSTSASLSASTAACEFINHRAFVSTYSPDEKYNITSTNSAIPSGGGSSNYQLESYPISITNSSAPCTTIQGNLYLSSVSNFHANKINRITAYNHNGTGIGRFGIYTKSGTTFTLVAQTGDVSISTTGMITGTFASDVTLDANTVYWIAFGFSSSYLQLYAMTDTGEISAPHNTAHIVTYLWGNPPSDYTLPSSITAGSSTTIRIWLTAWYQ